MKALSIRQPWAWLIVQGFKPVENRTWRTDYRGPFLIHASKTFDWDGFVSIADIDQEAGAKVYRHFGMSPNSPWRTSKGEFGGIVGEAVMIDCVASHQSKWFCGPYGFVLRDAKPLPFQPCSGELGFFDVKGRGI